MGQTFVISGIISLKGTVVSVYKDTLDKDNLGKIWPKPTLFGFSPSFYEDNLGKIQRVNFPKNLQNTSFS